MSYITDNFDDKIVELLKSGAVGFMPSDTIYGLSCRALDQKAVEKLHKIKQRDKNKPFIVLISKISQLNKLGIIATDVAPALRYWPGKLSIICEAEKAPPWLHLGTKTMAVRQPDYPDLQDLINKVGPIISTSANYQGDKPLTTAAAAKKYFGEKLDFYIDTGKIAGESSTIIRKDNYQLKIIRQGAVKLLRKE